jgi:hypothetical protein
VHAADSGNRKIGIFLLFKAKEPEQAMFVPGRPSGSRLLLGPCEQGFQRTACAKRHVVISAGVEHAGDIESQLQGRFVGE